MDVFPNSIQFIVNKSSSLNPTFPSPESFLAKFGADPSQLESLVSAKTVTIPRLLEISPHGTLDPSPFIYNSTLYTMVRLRVPYLFFSQKLSLTARHSAQQWLPSDQIEPSA